MTAFQIGLATKLEVSVCLFMAQLALSKVRQHYRPQAAFATNCLIGWLVASNRRWLVKMRL